MVNKPDRRWATFQLVEPFVPPKWPDPLHPQQIHLDIEVADLDTAEREVIALGATLLRADKRGWRIYADPAGHPFCLLPQHG